MSAEKPRRLGRGLEALIAGAASPGSGIGGSDLQRIQLSRIRANPFQPRRQFQPAELAELESSLKASGLLQPISVRKRGDAYELIAGERRLRAATNLGWTEISAVVRDFDDQAMLVLALVENLQRANLNAIEEAVGYRRLQDDFKLTHQQVADAVGKDRTTVTNLLRILSLPATVQALVQDGKLSTGHARALLALASADAVDELAAKAVAESWSVRETEARVRERNHPVPSSTAGNQSRQRRSATTSPAASSSVRGLEDDLRRYLQTDIKVQLAGAAKGRIEVSFYSHEDLDRILDLILREKRADF